MFSKKQGRPAPKPMAAPVSNGSTFSVIGADVVIKGDIEASADLHIDGTVQGDIACASLVQGESSRVEGAITAETARLAGSVKGTITARELIVLKSARIEGDVHYETLTIEQGASVEGRFAPDSGSAAQAPTQPAAAKSAKSGGKSEDSEPHLSLAG